MSEPNTTNTPQVAESNHENVEEQISLFSTTQYESAAPTSNSAPGFDPSWQQWDLQSQNEVEAQSDGQEIRKVQENSISVAGKSAVESREAYSTKEELGTDWKQLAAQLRNLSLQDLAHQFGFELDRSDKSKWRASGFCISINDNKFFDHYADKGGVGAIDFTMHVKGCSFQDAVALLAHERPVPTPHHDRYQEKYPRCNAQDESKWQAARSYLVDQRGLPEQWIDSLHQQGLISVDSRQNIMFFRYGIDSNFERGEAIGANLRGTIPNRETGEFFKGLTTGTTREEGYFWFEQGHGQIKQVVITESPIDAISYAALGSSLDRSIYISSDGQGVVPIQALKQVLDQGSEIILAYDHDRQGDRMAWQTAHHFPDVVLKREVPTIGKDWNDELLGKDSPLDPRQEIGDRLWKWYEVSKRERATIIQIGIEFNAANKPRDLTSAEMSWMEQAIPRTDGEANLTTATEILRIAERAYAYGENMGHLQFDGEVWAVAGNSYTLRYDSTNDIFEIEGRNGMFVQRLAGQINLDTMTSLSSLDLEVFQETERFLNHKEFSTTQSPSQTVAIAQEKQNKPQFSATNEIDSPTPQQPTLQELRNWYKQARDLGRSDTHLSQIEQVGKAFVQGHPLSQQSLQALSDDKTDWENMVGQIAQNAQSILSLAGHPHADGTLFQGKQYLLYCQDDYLYVLAPERGKQPKESDSQRLPVDVLASNPGIILKLEQDKVVPPTRVTSADHQRFEQFAHQIAQKNLQLPAPHEYDR